MSYRNTDKLVNRLIESDLVDALYRQKGLEYCTISPRRYFSSIKKPGLALVSILLRQFIYY